MAYPLGLLFLVYVSAMPELQPYLSVITGLFPALIYIAFFLVYTVKTAKMKQSSYFENIKAKAHIKAHENHVSLSAPKSQFSVVVRHEIKYLLTLKSQILNFGLLCFTPAIFTCLLPRFTGMVDLNYAVIVSVLMIPRVPSNLIAYSVGGEKVYKTGESLLSTPLNVRTVFLAKSIVPVLISAAMLAASSLITLISVDILSRLSPEAVSSHTYTAAQLVLLFPVSILSCVLMVFISGVLSLTLKTPRQALYASSLIGFVFLVPTLAIIYLTQNMLMWSAIYSIGLLLCSIAFVKIIFGKVTLPEIISKL
jgi:hypothetical protein